MAPARSLHPDGNLAGLLNDTDGLKRLRKRHDPPRSEGRGDRIGGRVPDGQHFIPDKIFVLRMDNVVAVAELKDAHRQQPPADGSLDKGQANMSSTGRGEVQQTSHRQDALRSGLLRHEALQRVDPAGQPTRAVGVLDVDEPPTKDLFEGVEVGLPFRS